MRTRKLPRILLARIAFPHRGAGSESVGDERQPLGGYDAADRVGLQDRRRGVRPALRHTHQHAVVAAHPHQVVGERQVGQQLPLPHHRVQVVHRVARQHGVFGEQITESGHRQLPSRSPAVGMKDPKVFWG